MKINHGEIRKGDRIYARLVMGSRTIVELMLETVSGMTDVLGEIRKKCRSVRGLARLYVRNHSRGWAEERPLMLYSSAPVVSAATSGGSGFSSPFSGRARTPRPHMPFPWETH